MNATIHPTAIISPKATLGTGASVGPFSIIHGDVEIGDGATIDGHCEIGYPTPLAEGRPLVLGRGARIRSHSVFYQGSSFGEGLVTGHRVTVRELTTAGRSFQIGTMADIQGHCEIGHHVRTQSSVTIGQKSRIGNFVWLFPGALLTNDPTPPSDELLGVILEDYVVVGVKATLLPGVRIGRGSFVAAHSLVGTDMVAGSMVSGSPAKRLCDVSVVRMKNDVRAKAYPWAGRFTRGYPDEVVQAWAQGKFDFEF
jgi:acyl-[acyl carrier protein]--UDP-N-acetylglucosamine O-acyltransferase